MTESMRAEARESGAMSLEVYPAHWSQTLAVVRGNCYAVACGLCLRIYDLWNKCAPQVIGAKGAVYKSFPTKEQAEEFLHQRRLA